MAYLRVSTEDQRLGPEAQRASIEAWAAREGVTIASWHLDQGVSGSTPPEARSGLLDALASLRTHGAATLVVAKRDRLARDLGVAALVERAVYAAGGTVATADGASTVGGVEGMMLRGMADLFAAVERELIRTRTRDALARKKARGEKLGGRCPYGYRVAADGVTLTPDPDEQTTVALVRDLSTSGLSRRGIVADLARRGVVSRVGRPLQLTQITNILTRT